MFKQLWTQVRNIGPRMETVFRWHRVHRIDAAYCCSRHTFRGLCVRVLGARANPAKSAEPVEMPFERQTFIR